MSTSESHENGRLVLSAAMPGVAFTVVDGTFQAVARGVGTLDVELPQGIYEISIRAGGSVTTELVSLHPGETYKRTDISTGVYAAAPLPASATANPVHAAAVTAVSSQVATLHGPPAGLVIAVRRIGEGATPLHHEQLTVLDRELRPVTLPDWEVRDGIAVLGARLSPGAYVLRLKPSKGPALDQTIWLSEGWQTLVFCPNGAERADLDDASVHLGRLGQAFPGDAADLATAVEIATSGLRQGLPLVNQDLLQVLRDSDFANPMLGITGAHALLLRDPPSLTEFCEVAAELRSILPDHPDVLALATHPACRVAGTSVSWPPMLAASYDKLLLPADQVDTDSILDGSPAERVAGYVVQRGPWLCWEATEAMLRPAPLPALPALPDEQTQLLSATTEGASRRVQKHVLEVANLTGNSQPQVAGSLGATELAKRLQLPIQTVRAVLAELGWDKVLLGVPDTGPITTIDETEERLEPVPRGTSPFAGPLPDPVYETSPRSADTEAGPSDEAEPAGPAKSPEPAKPKPGDGPDRRWIFMVAGVVTAVLLVIAGARVFGGAGGGGDVSLKVASMPDFFDRVAVPSQNITVAIAGNSDPQRVDARVDAAEYAADASGCKAVAAGRTCVVRVTFKPGPRDSQPKLASLVLSTSGSDELTVPLFGTTRTPEGEISVEWTDVKPARLGETVRPTVAIDNIPPGDVHSVVRVTVPEGFEVGTFDAKDKCDARRGTVIFCWVGLDAHHDDWKIRIPLIARSGTGGPIKVDAQLSRNRDIPDPDPGDNTAEATLTVTAG